MSEYYWEKGEDDVESPKYNHGDEDNVRDFVIDSEEEFDEASEEKEDRRVQHDGGHERSHKSTFLKYNKLAAVPETLHRILNFQEKLNIIRGRRVKSVRH